MIFEPKINIIYDWAFKSPVSDINGIYKLISVVTHDELISSNRHSIKNDFYKKFTDWGSDTAEERFEADFNLINSNPIYHLYPVNEDPLEENKELGFFVPRHFVLNEPNPNVLEVRDLKAVALLGTFRTSDELGNIVTRLNDVVGTINGELDSVKILQTKSNFISEAEYKTIEDNRNTLKDQNKTYTQMLLEKDLEIDRLQNIIQQLTIAASS